MMTPGAVYPPPFIPLRPWYVFWITITGISCWDMKTAGTGMALPPPWLDRGNCYTGVTFWLHGRDFCEFLLVVTRFC